jgi:hypothetical protein
VYPAAFGTQAVAHYAGAREEGGWYYVKVLWVADPRYAGPALIRGRQIDGSDELRFEWGSEPAAELWFTELNGTTDDGWRDQPSYTRVRAPGCYAYQVDGLDFTEVIVFEAIP